MDLLNLIIKKYKGDLLQIIEPSVQTSLAECIFAIINVVYMWPYNLVFVYLSWQNKTNGIENWIHNIGDCFLARTTGYI